MLESGSTLFLSLRRCYKKDRSCFSAQLFSRNNPGTQTSVALTHQLSEAEIRNLPTQPVDARPRQEDYQSQPDRSDTEERVTALHCLQPAPRPFADQPPGTNNMEESPGRFWLSSDTKLQEIALRQNTKTPLFQNEIWLF